MFPEHLRYTKDHEWVRLEGGQGVVGVTDHAQKALGDIVFLELPEVGRSLSRQEGFGTVESVKAVSELFSPLTGKVAEINQGAVDNPEIINADPYGEAWMIKVELSSPGETDDLMDATAYRAYVEAEAK